MSACYPEMFKDHESDLFSAMESVIFLSLLFCMDLSEVRLFEDDLQGGHDLRIKRLEVWAWISKD